MLIAVTGALGFIGQEVIETLLRDVTSRVIAVDFLEDVISGYEEKRFPIIERVYSTLSRCEDFIRPFEFIEWLKRSRVDCVIHLGATVDTMDYGKGTLFANNVDYVRDLVGACNDNRESSEVPGIVFASSAAVYGVRGFPVNPYGMTKSLGEKIVASSRGRHISLRFFNVFGALEHHKASMASVPFKLAQAYRDGQTFNMHSLDSKRDFVPVSTVADRVCDFVDGLARSRMTWTADGLSSGIFDLGTGRATSFDEIDRTIMHSVGATTSCVREVAFPPSLMGRYQHYTRAGDRGIVNVGAGTVGTVESIERVYGNR